MPKSDWQDVEQRFEALRGHLRGHFDDAGTEASAERRALQESVRGLVAALGNSFDAVRDSVHDPMVRRDLTAVGESVRAALTSSFDAAGAQLRRKLSQSASDARTAAGKPATKKNNAP